jgi:iron(III) transport system substrate-binding protein
MRSWTEISRWVGVAALSLGIAGASIGAEAQKKAASKAASKAAASKTAIPPELIAGANKEGRLKLAWTGTATDDWRQKFQDAFNQQYGIKVVITHSPSSNFGRDVSKVMTEVSAGQKPSFDLMLFADSAYADLAKAGLLGEHSFSKLFGVPDRSVQFNGGAFAFAHQLVLPAYNTNLVKGADIPKSWDDFLNPKWKGKIGVPSATHLFARLSQDWGDEKTTQFVTKLSAQGLRLGAFGDLNQSLQLGEIHLMTGQIDNRMTINQEKKAPIAWAVNVQPILALALMAGPLKNAENPNAALLFSGFLASPKGQALWHDFQNQTSIFAEGSASWKLVQGKKVATLSEVFMMKDFTSRTSKYGKILGYR